MFEPEKQRITLKIAQQQLKTQIDRESEERIRKVEKEVNNLWNEWRQLYPSRTDAEILAMVAFQYAVLYYDEKAKNDTREASLMKFIKEYEEKLKKIVLDV